MPETPSSDENPGQYGFDLEKAAETSSGRNKINVANFKRSDMIRLGGKAEDGSDIFGTLLVLSPITHGIYAPGSDGSALKVRLMSGNMFPPEVDNKEAYFKGSSPPALNNMINPGYIVQGEEMEMEVIDDNAKPVATLHPLVNSLAVKRLKGDKYEFIEKYEYNWYEEMGDLERLKRVKDFFNSFGKYIDPKNENGFSTVTLPNGNIIDLLWSRIDNELESVIIYDKKTKKAYNIDRPKTYIGMNDGTGEEIFRISVAGFNRKPYLLDLTMPFSQSAPPENGASYNFSSGGLDGSMAVNLSMKPYHEGEITVDRDRTIEINIEVDDDKVKENIGVSRGKPFDQDKWERDLDFIRAKAEKETPGKLEEIKVQIRDGQLVIVSGTQTRTFPVEFDLGILEKTIAPRESGFFGNIFKKNTTDKK